MALPFAAVISRVTQLELRGDGADPKDLLRGKGILFASANVGLLTILGLHVWVMSLERLRDPRL